MQAPTEFTPRNDVPPFREAKPEGGYIVHWSDPQQSFAESEAPVTVMQAGRQSGKTTSEVEILALEMDRCGPGDYLFAAPTYPLMEARIKPELRDCFCRYRGFIERPGYHRFESLDKGENGAPLYRILLGSAVNPESLASSTVKAAIIDELAQNSFPWAAWNEIQRAVAVNQGRIYAGTTLYDVSGAYKLEIYDRWMAGDPRINIIMADSLSNPAFPVAEYEYFRETMPPWKFDMMYRGRYSRPVGLVYDCFNEETQVIPRIPTEQMKDWPRYWGHDFGPNNTAAVCLAQDPVTGLMYVEKTYHRGELSVGQHAEEFKEMSRDTSVRLRAGGNRAEEEARYAYTASGWPIIQPGVSDVDAGISQVYSWAAKNQLFVFNDLTEFLNELLTYSLEVTDTFQVTDRIRNKSSYHLMDCLRYIISTLPVERSLGNRKSMLKTYSSRDKRHIPASPFAARR